MNRQRTVVTAGFLAVILSFGMPAVAVGPHVASHRDGGDCNREGNCNDQRRCQGDGCRGSFSPGPFDRSPVDIHDNTVCISPDCSSHNDKKGQS